MKRIRETECDTSSEDRGNRLVFRCLRYTRVLVIPALVFVTLGMAVLIEPQILAWIVGVVLIVMGVAMLVFGRFMRRFAERS